MQMPSGRLSPPSAVTVDAPARLHLGFIDPNASLGRAFGSVGLTIDTHGTRITARHAEAMRVEGATSEAQRARIERYLEQVRSAFGGSPVAVEVNESPRSHTGLGSGTQLALAVGTAYVRLAGRGATTTQIARLLERGARSGIGIHGFDHGGLMVDGGHGANFTAGSARVPPLLFRQPFPEAWRVLLVDDTSREGLHGDEERRGLAALGAFPRALAAHLSHLVLMRILPGIAESDFDAFAKGIGELQQTIGDYFAPVQGGVFSSPAVESVLDAVAAVETAGIGQTSWGPTGFAFLRGERQAERALAVAREASRALPSIACSIATGRNRGAHWRTANQEKCGIDAA
jgi:beta-RFAP synthase